MSELAKWLWLAVVFTVAWYGLLLASGYLVLR